MFLRRIQDLDECGKGKGLHLGGGHRTYFLDLVNDWGRDGGTPHILCSHKLHFKLGSEFFKDSQWRNQQFLP